MGEQLAYRCLHDSPCCIFSPFAPEVSFSFRGREPSDVSLVELASRERSHRY